MAKAKSDKTAKATTEPVGAAAAAGERKPRKPARKKAVAPARAAPAADAGPADKAPAAPAKTGPADRPWLENYPEGMPAEIGPLSAASVGELMANACRQYANRPAFTCMGKSITFAELERLSSSFAALSAVDRPEGRRAHRHHAAQRAADTRSPCWRHLRAGLVVVNVNPLYTPRELEYQLKDSGAEAIVILENFATTLEQVIAKTRVKHVIVARDGRPARPQGRARQLRRAPREEDGAGVVAARSRALQRTR